MDGLLCGGLRSAPIIILLLCGVVNYYQCATKSWNNPYKYQFSGYFSQSLIFMEAICLYYSNNSQAKSSHSGKRHIQSRTQT